MRDVAPLSISLAATGKMPVPLENSSLASRASCPLLRDVAPLSISLGATGKMPVPLENSSLASRASCPLLRMVPDVRSNLLSFVGRGDGSLQSCPVSSHRGTGCWKNRKLGSNWDDREHTICTGCGGFPCSSLCLSNSGEITLIVVP